MAYDWNKVIGILAGIISASAFIPYIRSILKKESKPSIATWFVWTLVGGMICASYFVAGGWTTTIWASMVYVVAPAVIFFLSLKYGKKNDVRIRFVEKVCIAGALLGLFVWLITKSTLIALAIFLLIDFFGAIPTMVKSYYYPREENMLAWMLSFTGSTLNLFAIQSLTFAVAGQPLYMFFNISITTAIMIFGRIRKV